MEKFNDIVVLLSSYNGEEYIQDQIDSILSQSKVNVKLIIRDDGSTDSTPILLTKYNQLPNVDVVYGDNVGACKSFLWLIENAPECDYYSFCDQDDVWDNDKLYLAITKLESNNAILYHGLAGKVDKHLTPIANDDYIPIDSFGASLMSSATGCTMVFKDVLMKKLQKVRPTNVSMHDAWVYRSCYALGYKVYYDKGSHMKYRQHENNVSGGQMTWSQKLNKIKRNSGLKYNVASDIKACFWNEMSDDNRRTLMLFINYKKCFLDKVKVMFSNKFNQRKITTNILNKVLFFLNLI